METEITRLSEKQTRTEIIMDLPEFNLWALSMFQDALLAPEVWVVKADEGPGLLDSVQSVAVTAELHFPRCETFSPHGAQSVFAAAVKILMVLYSLFPIKY